MHRTANPIRFVVAVACAAAGAAAANLCPAAEVTVAGKVAVTAAVHDRITAATFTAGDGTVYNIEMDTPGRDFARVMFGQQSNVRGVVTERDGKKWLKLTGFAEDKFLAAHELWRRTRCNACAVQKGQEHSAAPRDLKGAVPVAGRLYPYKQVFRATARDGKYLWLATDSAVYQVDLAEKKLVRTIDRSAGLSEQPVTDIASDGATLWIVSRNSAAALPVGADKAVPLKQVRCAFARVLVPPFGGGAWIIADSGTYRFTSPTAPPKELPAIPTGKRMAADLARGMWMPYWKQNTGHYITKPVAIGERLYVASFGDIYELANDFWKKLIPGGSEQQVILEGKEGLRGQLFALTPTGVVEYDPQKGALKKHALPKEIVGGRLTSMATAWCDGFSEPFGPGSFAVWVTAEPIGPPMGASAAAAGASKEGPDAAPAGGGIARLDVTTGKWQAWSQINGQDASRAVLWCDRIRTVWVATHQGKYKSLAAHPGMTYVQRTLFTAEGFALHRWDAAKGAWETFPLPYERLAKRHICGQDGQGADGQIGPQMIESLCVTENRVFATVRLMPEGVFSGYWTCVEQVASQDASGKWTAKFQHDPAALDMQGEQPLVLNISNKGEMVVEAVGHPDAMTLGDLPAQWGPWALTEHCLGVFDPTAGKWNKVVQLGYNFYWRPTAVLDEGEGVFVGSDRGLISRLDLKTGRFDIIGGLKDRMITTLARHDGRLVALGDLAPLGQLPADMVDKPVILDAKAAEWDGTTWKPTSPPLVALSGRAWEFRPAAGWPTETSPRRPFIREQQIGNMLFGPGPGGKDVPRYYVKEVYAPKPVGFGQAGKRMWLSTFAGLVAVDLP